MQTILTITQQFSSKTPREREQNVRAMLEQYLKNQLIQKDDDQS